MRVLPLHKKIVFSPDTHIVYILFERLFFFFFFFNFPSRSRVPDLHDPAPQFEISKLNIPTTSFMFESQFKLLKNNQEHLYSYLKVSFTFPIRIFIYKNNKIWLTADRYFYFKTKILD